MTRDQIDHYEALNEYPKDDFTIYLLELTDLDGTTPHELPAPDFAALQAIAADRGYDIKLEHVIAVNGLTRYEWEEKNPIEGLNGEEEARAYDTKWSEFVRGEEAPITH